MKSKLNRLSYYVLFGLLSMQEISCDEPEIVSEEPTCATFLLGDRDGFGMGLLPGYPLVLPGGTSLPIDYRVVTDPVFTDIYPCDMASSASPTHEVLFEFDFIKPKDNIESATLKLITLGIQDGDTQVAGSDTDIKLFLDNMEIPKAFDHVDQFANINGIWSDFVSNVEIEVPLGILTVLNDGKIQVRIEILQLNVNSQSYDGFAIDYCELEMCFSVRQ